MPEPGPGTSALAWPDHASPNHKPAGCLIDLDGTVDQDGRAIPGAAAALAALRRHGVPFRFTTNTTRRPRTALAERLAAMDIPVDAGEILSAPSIAELPGWIGIRDR